MRLTQRGRDIIEALGVAAFFFIAVMLFAVI